MAASDDSRPFAILKQSAEDFKSAFEEDITQCLAVLDSKITELLCDQDSVTGSYGDAKTLNAHMEFSKAKLEIFVSMKSLLNEMEASWVEQLSELKEACIENIEIFLAGTKLEVKRPTDMMYRSGSKRSKSYLKGYQSSPSALAVSSLYPTLMNTAKHIPVLNSLLPKTEDEESESDETNNINSSFSKNTKHVRKFSASPPMKETPETATRRKNTVRFMEVEITKTNEVKDEEMEDEEEEPAPVQTPLKTRGRGKKSTTSTPTSLRKAPGTRAAQNEFAEVPEDISMTSHTPVKTGRGSKKYAPNTPASFKKTQPSTPLRRRNLADNDKGSLESSSSDSSVEDKQDSQAMKAVAETKTRRGTIKSQLSTEAVVHVAPGRQTRTRAKRGGSVAVKPEVAVPVSETETSESESNNYGSTLAGPRTPKNVHFSVGMDINEDLEIYSPEINISRSAPRRKTAYQFVDSFPDLCLTPDVIRTKAKRKTIMGVASDLIDAPSPKRLKKGRRSNVAPSMASEENEPEESDLLDSDEAPGQDNYTPWIALADVGGKVPTQPGVYELKVSQAKKPAYIGSCESLRQKLTLHKLKHSTGHKHLDKFVERNAINILVRYERMSSAAEAKLEEKNRVKAFVSVYNTTPAYN